MSGHGDLLARLAADHRRLLGRVGELAAARGQPAWLVGGSVRDLILELPSEDLDVVVEGDGMALAQDLARDAGGQLTRHHAFGTARVDLPGDQRVDFATARGETYARPGELPQVAAGSLAEDLARRDFTINTIALRLDGPDTGTLTDPFDGLGDIDRGLVRFLHEASFSDDPTRTLRAVRFALRFGYELEERTAAALADAAVGGFLEWLTGDRLRREFRKLLEESPVEGPSRLASSGLLAGIHPRLRAPRSALERLAEGLAEAPLEARLRWSAVLAVMAIELESQERWELARRLRLSREQREPLIDGGLPWARLREWLAANEEPDGVEAVEAVETLGPGTLLAGRATLEHAAWRERLDRLCAAAAASRPTLGGDELRELGCPAGPAMGELLRVLRAARLRGEVSDAEAERELARRWIEEQ